MSKEHINLPKTAFSMKAGLPIKEPGIIEYWQKINLYEKLREKSLDLLFANNAIETFNNDNITVTAIDRDAEKQIGPATKLLVARQIIELISTRLRGEETN
mgnify:CR=1 FL=1